MIKFSLPGYYIHYEINMMLLSLYKIKRHYFKKEIEITSFYDSLPHLIWNGCRILSEGQVINSLSSDIYSMRDSYYDFGMTLRHTFTNNALTPEMMYDYRSNQWAAACEKEGNAVIVGSEMMANYIREKYPKYDIIWSTSIGIKDINTINKISEKDMVVLDYTLNRNENTLSKLTNPKNIEILCAEYCIDNCPHRKEHYNATNKIIINQEGEKDFKCPFYTGEQNFYYYLKHSKHILTYEDILILNKKYNIENFKLNGRSVHWIAYIEILVYYLIKNEYKDYVRQMLLLGKK